MEISQDLVSQEEDEKQNYDEYNENNKLVNDISYSYYLHNKNSNNNLDNNQTISQDNNNQNNLKSQTINRRYNSQLTNIDENFDNTLKNKSINKNNSEINNINSSGLNVGRMSSTLDIRLGERERKKMLLDNIQTQITLRKKTKLEELKKRQEEDAQYLKDMILRYPFGRAGGGAPIRDKSGNIVTFRRNLISNLKYNQSSIDVDDDFDEVWGKDRPNRKNIVKSPQNINLNNNFNDENTIRPFSTNPHINSIKNNNTNFGIYQNNKYGNHDNSPLKQSFNFSTNNSLNIGNNSNINKLNNSFDLLNNNNLFYKNLLERKKKELELEKQLEMENEQLQENYNINHVNTINLRKKNNRTTNKKKLVYNYNTIDENEENEEIEENNENINENKYLNKKDYYDNFNFVQKGQIHPRLENSFLFTDEINKLRNEIRFDQNSLLDEINAIKKDAKNATKERKNIIKDLEYLKSQINMLNEIQIKQKEEEEIQKEKENQGKIIFDDKYDEFIEERLRRKQNDDYYYIDNSTFQNYENELPNQSIISKEKNILNLKNNDIEENQMELEDLIQKNNDILENLRENEFLEKKYKKRPEDYFNTSDAFFHTYRLTHADNYKEYDANYNKYYINKDINYDNEHDNDYEVKVEKI